MAFRSNMSAILAAAALLTGCDTAESRRLEETRRQLVGTWLRASEAGSIEPRRVLVLDPDGKFRDRIQINAKAGGAERLEYGGEWSYDGANIKRRYLQENGRQFSGGKMRYLTFPLVSVSGDELVLDDNKEGRKVGYRRVQQGTEP